jgi:hypothetical protein
MSVVGFRGCGFWLVARSEKPEAKNDAPLNPAAKT